MEAPSEEQQTEEVAEQAQQTQELEQEPEKAEAAPAEAEESQVPVAPRIQEQEKPTESFFARLKRSLSRTKANIGAGFFGLFSGKKNR